MKSWISEVGKVLGGMKEVFSCRAMGMNVKKRLYEGVAVPTAVYMWGRSREEEIKYNGSKVSGEYVWNINILLLYFVSL